MHSGIAPFPFLLYMLLLFSISHLYVLQTQYIGTMMALYNPMSFKGAKKQQEKTNVFIVLKIVTFLFTVAGSFHFLLWIQVTLCTHLLTPQSFHSHPFLCIVIVNHITFFLLQVQQYWTYIYVSYILFYTISYYLYYYNNTI